MKDKKPNHKTEDADEIEEIEDLSELEEQVEEEPEEPELVVVKQAAAPKQPGSHALTVAFLGKCDHYESDRPKAYAGFLKDKWKEVFTEDPPRIPLDMLKRRIGYQLQVQDFLDSGQPVPVRIQHRMRELADDIEWYVKHRKNDPVEPEQTAEVKPKAERKKAEKKDKPAGPRKTIADAMEELFKVKGPDASLADCIAAAKAVKPDSAFQETHRLYYRNLWVKNKRCRK